MPPLQGLIDLINAFYYRHPAPTEPNELGDCQWSVFDFRCMAHPRDIGHKFEYPFSSRFSLLASRFSFITPQQGLIDLFNAFYCRHPAPTEPKELGDCQWSVFDFRCMAHPWDIGYHFILTLTRIPSE